MALFNVSIFGKLNQTKSLLFIALKLSIHNQKFFTSTIKMNRPRVLITRPDIPSTALNLLKEQ